MIGTAVGSYRITAKIAEGGMGTVYRAEHTAQGKVFAIKILHPELSHNRSIVDRFFNEAKATTAIRHPGIVEVFDFGYLPTGHAFLVMEFLEGEPLSRYLKRRGGRIPEGDAAWLISGMCSALAAAHAKNIIHRDLKPDNVFMVPDPESGLRVRPKLLDFGIAKLSGSEISSSKTRTGSVLGTPTYMSPEQCKGTGEVDQRADLYSLGCILYEMLCGRPPFVSEGAGELIGAHLFVAADSPKVYAPTVSGAMESMVLQLLAKNRDQRPANATELGNRLASLARASGATLKPSGAPPLRTPPRGVPATGAPAPAGGAPGAAGRPMIVDAATVMESLSGPGSGPMRAIQPATAGPTTPVPGPTGPNTPRPPDSWQQPMPMHPMPMQPMHPMHPMPMHPMPMHPMHPMPMHPMPTPPPPFGMPMPTPPPPMPTPPHPMMMTPAHPLMMTPPPMPTPAPQSVTTLSGAAGVRPGESDRPRARWVVAIAVIILFAGASALTTYLVVGRKATKKSAGGGTPTHVVQPPKQEVQPPAAVPVPAPAPAPPPTPAPPPEIKKKDHKKPDADIPGNLIDLDGKKPERKKKKPGPKPPGPIETDI